MDSFEHSVYASDVLLNIVVLVSDAFVGVNPFFDCVPRERDSLYVGKFYYVKFL